MYCTVISSKKLLQNQAILATVLNFLSVQKNLVLANMIQYFLGWIFEKTFLLRNIFIITRLFCCFALHRRKARWHHSATVHSSRIHRLESVLSCDGGSLRVMDYFDSCWTGSRTDVRCFLCEHWLYSELQPTINPLFLPPPFKKILCASEKGWIKDPNTLFAPTSVAIC